MKKTPVTKRPNDSGFHKCGFARFARQCSSRLSDIDRGKIEIEINFQQPRYVYEIPSEWKHIASVGINRRTATQSG